ncbi:hypothetical protein AVP43_02464 [Geobacillus stearothermophilus]|nr:hypothetical protein AVP43_02464 [Geobacillus stearothermophilus]
MYLSNIFVFTVSYYFDIFKVMKDIATWEGDNGKRGIETGFSRQPCRQFD